MSLDGITNVSGVYVIRNTIKLPKELYLLGAMEKWDQRMDIF